MVTILNNAFVYISKLVDSLDMLKVLAVSIGIMVVIITLLMIEIQGKSKGKFKYLSDMEGPYNKFKRRLKRNFEQRKRIILNQKEKYIIVGIAILLTTTASSVKSSFTLLAGGALTGLSIILFVRNVKSKNVHIKKVNEIAIVFESIELYMRAGYSMYQAIRTSRLLITEIRPAMDVCLSYWGNGPKQALAKLQEELNVPEAETLILMLVNLEGTGSKEMRSAIGGEVFNIESIQRMKTNVSIANKPLLLMIYRMLPLGSVIGITVGSLMYRTFSVLQHTGIGAF